MARHPLINKQKVRRYMLDYAQRNRSRFTRVGDSAYDQIEAAIRDKCRRIVETQPSIGKTIR